MNPLTITIAALVATTPAPHQAVAENPPLCFRTMAYTNFQIPIPCAEVNSFAEARESARLLPATGEARVPVYFARCSAPVGGIGCQANRLGTTIVQGAGLTWDNTPIGYAFDPASKRPPGSKVLIECYETHAHGYVWGSTIVANIWHYMVADEQADAASCRHYWGNGSYTGQVVGYVFPV